MIRDTITVKGLTDLGKFMQELAPKLERNVLRAALKAGAKVVKEAAQANCPVAAPSRKGARVYGGYPAALRDSLRYDAKIDLKGGKVMAYVRAGGKARKSRADTFYASWVEYGTAAHQNGSFMHPGAQPRPFMRPALDAEAERALLVIGNYIKMRLEQKHGLDTAGITIGVDE